MVAILARPAKQRAGAELTRWGITAASSRQSAVSRYGPAAQGQADGLYRLSGRIPRRREDAQSIIMSPGAARARGPRTPLNN